LQGTPQRREVNLGVKAADHAPRPQRTQTRQRRGRRHSDSIGEPLIGDPRVLGHDTENRSVDGIDRRLWIVQRKAA
jgi:hypothetical protein